MSADFTIITTLKKGFGDELGYTKGMDPEVDSVEPTRDFTFLCPNVDPRQAAVLMFQSRDVDSTKNKITINGFKVAGGIPVSPDEDAWNGNVMTIAAGVLQASGNRLHIESRNNSGTGGGDIDDFILDNVVVMYKTR